ncbi:MAG: carbonic anhydrase family protein [Methylococcaceae bacterium]|nr:carbonic anhydrase family protein [Methylococcaceae bacterium]
MKTKLSLLTLTILATGCATTTQHTSHNKHWSYTGHEGPEYWGALDPKNSACDKGVNQSPINLTGFIESDLSPLKLEYSLGGHEILNNGHTIQVNYQAGNKLGVNGHFYELKQFHFHSPSENHINGKSYPMEMHLVHADTEGNLAVVAVVFEEGSRNETLKEIWNTMPEVAGNKRVLPSIVSVNGLLPSNRDYYRFNGSLTTPPCTEGVLWLVMKQPVTITKEQINQFTGVMYQPNNRPVQSINARPVLK